MFHVEPNKSSHIIAEPIDHLVSKRTFQIIWDEQSQIAITSPFPSEDTLSSYYDSDDYISHGNPNKTISDFLYRLVQIFMFSRKRKWLAKYLVTDKTVLDYGCGTGSFVTYLLKKQISSFGIEPNEKARSLSESKKNIFPSFKDVDKTSFDVITLWHVLEHIPDQKNIFTQLISRFHNKSTLIIALPNLQSFDCQYYKSYWAGFDVPRHLWHYSPQGIAQFATSFGLKLVETKAMWFDSLYLSYLSEKQSGAFFPLVRGIFVGMYSNLKAIRSKNYSSIVYVFQKES